MHSEFRGYSAQDLQQAEQPLPLGNIPTSPIWGPANRDCRLCHWDNFLWDNPPWANLVWDTLLWDTLPWDILLWDNLLWDYLHPLVVYYSVVQPPEGQPP